MDHLTYYIDKKVVTVFIERTKNKNMYLKITKNEIHCLAPFSISDEIIKQFVAKHINKFAKELQKIQNNTKYSLIFDFLYFKGRKYYFKRLGGFTTPGVEIINNKIYIKTSDSTDFVVKKTIVAFLKDELYKYLEDNFFYWLKKMKLDIHVFTIMSRKTVWGLNVIGKKQIKFTYHLAHYKPKIIDYVIVHELAHSYEPNHSKEFWNIVKKYIPNYKDVKLLLNNNSDLNDL